MSRSCGVWERIHNFRSKMESPTVKKKRIGRSCKHCDAELCQSQYSEHKQRYFRNGVWERISKSTRCDDGQEPLSSNQKHTGGSSSSPLLFRDLQRRESKETAKPHPPPNDLENYIIEDNEEIPPPTDHPDNNEIEDDQSIDSSDTDSLQDDDANISCFLIHLWSKLHSKKFGHCQPCDQSCSPGSADDDKKLLTAISGLSCQLTQFAADVNQQLTAVNSKLQSMEARMSALDEKVYGGSSVEESRRKRRAHNPRIAEAVRRLHNSEANCRRYKPDQSLSSPHNEAVTSDLVRALAINLDLQSVDNDAILSACKTYYETVRRNFRYSQPDLAAQAEAMKSSARSRQRRKRLLEARQSVLAADELDFWRGVTIDMMSDEEDGTFEGVSGWIVRPPSYRSQKLTDLCAILQARLDANPKYTATHHRRLHIGPDSERVPPNTYDPDAAERHFKAHLIPSV